MGPDTSPESSMMLAPGSELSMTMAGLPTRMAPTEVVNCPPVADTTRSVSSSCNRARPSIATGAIAGVGLTATPVPVMSICMLPSGMGLFSPSKPIVPTGKRKSMRAWETVPDATLATNQSRLSPPIT